MLRLRLKSQDEAFFSYNPGLDQLFSEGAQGIALGDLVALERLRSLLAPQEALAPPGLIAPPTARPPMPSCSFFLQGGARLGGST